MLSENAIKKLLKEYKISYEEVAHYYGCSRQYIAKIINKNKSRQSRLALNMAVIFVLKQRAAITKLQLDILFKKIDSLLCTHDASHIMGVE
jgi:transcriptional regulator with XRE-family HTH domain